MCTFLLLVLCFEVVNIVEWLFRALKQRPVSAGAEKGGCCVLIPDLTCLPQVLYELCTSCHSRHITIDHRLFREPLDRKINGIPFYGLVRVWRTCLNFPSQRTTVIWGIRLSTFKGRHYCRSTLFCRNFSDFPQVIRALFSRLSTFFSKCECYSSV